ncbi:MAG: choice-of-anchor V domain-containing protein, partial [Poseidonia sp.]
MNTLARRLALLFVAVMITAVPVIEGSSSGKHSQASQGCTCHSNTGGTTVSHNFPSTYIAGAMYSITISIQTSANPTSGGFNVVVDKGQLMNPGTGVSLSGNPATSATHTSSGLIQWTFDWMAPFGGSGSATVDMAVLHANGNSANTGDSWGTTQVIIPEGLPPNDAPVASNVAVAPSPEADADESLTLTYDYADNDSDPESSQTEIHWYVDGTHNTAHNGKTTIEASLTQAGQKWKAQVTPHDGLEFGNAVMSNEVTILDIDS